jgi:hypothetical protein
MVTHFDVVYAAPDGLDDPAALVPEDDREVTFWVFAGESVGVTAGWRNLTESRTGLT